MTTQSDTAQHPWGFSVAAGEIESDSYPEPMVPFSLQCVANGPTTTLHVSGEVDLATAGELRGTALAALDAGADPLVIDLHEVTFLDSTGLQALIALNNRTADAGTQLSIRDPSAPALSVIRITGLDEVLPLDTTPE